MLKQMLGTSLYVGSAGVRKGELDAFAVAAMEEVGIDIHAHRPMTFEELEDLEGLNFDLIVTLVARGPPQGARAHPHARGRGRVLADRRSDRDRRQPRAADERVSGGARPIAAADPGAVYSRARRQRVARAVAHFASLLDDLGLASACRSGIGAEVLERSPAVLATVLWILGGGTGHVLRIGGSPVLGVRWIGTWRLADCCRVVRLR